MADPPLIPLFDIRLGDEHVDAVAATLRSGWLTMGPRTEELEAAFAEQLGVEHAVAMSCCTAALHIAMLAAGVGPGDEVIVPAITFVATAAAVRYCGGTPVIADVIGPQDLGIDPVDVEARITENTRAVCAVHYAGYAADVVALRSLCDRHGLVLIEDCAHSPSATAAGSERKLGGFGLAGTFSFFSNKVISCGEGGMLSTDDAEVAAFARSRRSHAMTSGSWDRHRGHAAAYDVVGLGFNYRLDEPRAALLLARLPGLEADIAERRRLVRRYRDQLTGLDGMSVPYTDDDVERSSCYVMPVLVDEPELRDPLRGLLLEKHRIQTSVLYPAIHEFSAYRELASRGLARSERAARSELTLPLFPHLTEAQQDRVLAGLEQSLAQLRPSPASAR